MAGLLRSPITGVWGLLIGMTLFSWYFGTDHGIASAEAASVVVLLIAFFKVRLVGLYFMELRHAPIPLRALFEGWCAVVCTTIVVLFLAT